jgi:hypothetical protein
MKRQLLSLIAAALLTSNILWAQSFKLEGTNYIGAMTENAAADWTKGWANFDPKNAAYGAPTDLTTLDGMAATLPTPGKKEITTTLTLDATKVYLLKGVIQVKDGGKLVIPAGTVIRCQSDLSSAPVNYATIVVERGGKIEITGTATNPVVITSAKAVGARDRGDWGGLLLAGRAGHNLWNAATDAIQMEGFKTIGFDGTMAKYGGATFNDNSGIIRYLRLEFGGLALATDQEINGLTFCAVGSGTEVSNVQVSFSGDDSFEWFGGTVNSKYLIAWKGTDDDFDTDFGYAGVNQFGLGVRDPAYFDLTYTTGGSTSEGFESDGENNGGVDVTASKLFTNAVFSNYTMVGPIAVGTTYADASSVVKAAFRRGARIRRNSSLRIVNSIFMGYRNFLMVEGDSCVRNTNFPSAIALTTPNTAVDAKTKQMMFSNNIICSTAASVSAAADTTANGLVEIAKAANYLDRQPRLTAINDWVRSTASANKIDPVAFTTGTLLVNPLAASTTPDFRPVAGSPALSGGGARFVGTPIGDLISDAKEIANAERFAPIFPNPISNGNVYFGREVATYGIFDISGKLVGHGFDTDHAPIQGMAAGIYFIKMDGKVQKLIVQ